MTYLVSAVVEAIVAKGKEGARRDEGDGVLVAESAEGFEEGEGYLRSTQCQPVSGDWTLDAMGGLALCVSL